MCAWLMFICKNIRNDITLKQQQYFMMQNRDKLFCQIVFLYIISWLAKDFMKTTMFVGWLRYENWHNVAFVYWYFLIHAKTQNWMKPKLRLSSELCESSIMSYVVYFEFSKYLLKKTEMEMKKNQFTRTNRIESIF